MRVKLYEDTRPLRFLYRYYLRLSIEVNGHCVMDPSPFEKFDNPKSGARPATSVWRGGARKLTSMPCRTVLH